jgi:hypothetical protein
MVEWWGGGVVEFRDRREGRGIHTHVTQTRNEKRCQWSSWREVGSGVEWSGVEWGGMEWSGRA